VQRSDPSPPVKLNVNIIIICLEDSPLGLMVNML